MALCVACNAPKKASESLNTAPESLSTKGDEALIKATFAGYKSAILEDRGADAVNFVDSRTINYYDRVLKHVINADSLEIAQLDVLDKMVVLSIRARTKADKILSMDGAQLFVYAIEEGMVGKGSVSQTHLSVMEVDGNAAKAFLTKGDLETPLFFDFYKEEGSWKIDITTVFDIGAKYLLQMVDEMGMTEIEFIFSALEQATGVRPGKEIFLPLK